MSDPVIEEMVEYNESYTPACSDAGVEPLSFWDWLKHKCTILSLLNQEDL